MSAIAFRRLFSQAPRHVARRATPSLRRSMATETTHAVKKSSDMPWMIGAGTVTVLGTAYILTPPSKKPAHKVAKASVANVEATYPPPEPVEKAAEPMKDDEGTEASAEEVGESIDKAISANAPKAAKAAEESSEKYEASSEDTEADASAAESQPADDTPEIREKPSKKGSSTFNQEGDHSPTDLGIPREHAKSGKAPIDYAREKAGKQESEDKQEEA